MTKSNHVALRLETEDRVALERAAKDDDRSISSMVRIIIADWLKKRGNDSGSHHEQPLF